MENPSLKTLDLGNLPAEAWRPMDALNGRASNRVSERELERIPAWIKTSQGNAYVTVTLWDYSPLGFALLYHYTKANPLTINPGDIVNVKIDLGNQILTADCKVENSSVYKNSLRIGLSRMDIPAVSNDSARPEELYLDAELDVAAETLNPMLFGEWAAVRLAGVQQGMRFTFVAEDPALCLFMGQEMEIQLAFPTSSDNCYRGAIVTLERQEDDSIRFGMSPQWVAGDTFANIAELLATEVRVSGESLKWLGFPTPFFSDKLVFLFETDPSANHLEEKTQRIVSVLHDEVLVASASVAFPDSQTATLKIEAAFPGSKFPCAIPKKTELLEINGLTTHQDYRRGELLSELLEHLARLFILSDRGFILNLAETSVLPLYLGVGFRELGHTCTYQGREHHLVMLSRGAVLRGEGMGLFAWNTLYGDLMADVLDKNVLDLDGWDLKRIRMKLLLRPLAKYLLGARRAKQFQRVMDEAKEIIST